MDASSPAIAAFEANRPRLRAVAIRMLGSPTDADDALQEAWLRVRRADAGAVENVDAWLTTIVARVCLNQLRARAARREASADEPEAIVSRDAAADPEHAALQADAVGVALLVVLESLTPAERLAFVLHDMFALPFEEIAPLVERSPEATRQLASRARRRVRGAAPTVPPDRARQRAVVDAFLAAAREGDFDALVTTLHPDVVLRADNGPGRALGSRRVDGAAAVAGQALRFRDPQAVQRPVLLDGTVAIATFAGARPVAVLGFTVVDGRIAAIDVVSDRDRLARLGVAALA